VTRTRRRSSKVRAFLAAFSYAERVVPFPPSVVWPLLVDPATWRLGGFVYCFDVVDGPPDLGPIRLLFWRATNDVVQCAPFRIVTNEPERRLVLRFAGPVLREWTLDLRVKPTRRGGSRLQIRSRLRPVRVWRRVSTQRHWDRRLSGWLYGVALVLSGQVDRPAASPAVEQTLALAGSPPDGRPPIVVRAEVDVRAPADVVWRLVWDPRTQIGTGESVLHAGYAPGTPVEAVGEMQYFLTERDGHLLVSAAVVTDLEPGRLATTFAVGQPFAIDHVVEPSATEGCTRLRLVQRCWFDTDQAALQESCTAAVESFKEFIEAAQG
jgi:hypothetical protein